SAPVVVVARPPKPTINAPLVEGSVSVTGQGVVGASIRLQINGSDAGTTAAGAGGAWSVALGQPLVAGQSVRANQTVGGVESDLPAAVIVVARPPAPVVTAPLVEGATSITGTAVSGASVELVVAGTPAGGATATGGAWTIALGTALVAGQQVAARQTVAG